MVSEAPAWPAKVWSPVKLPLPVLAMVMFSGSSSQSPTVPPAASALTDPVATARLWPEVSTEPPLPPSAPPWTLIAPLKTVLPSDHSTDRAAIAAARGVGSDRRALRHRYRLRSGERPGAMEIAADQNRAAAGIAGGVDLGARLQRDVGAQDLDRAAGLDRPAGPRRRSCR